MHVLLRCCAYLCHKSRIDIQQDCRVHSRSFDDSTPWWRLEIKLLSSKVPKISFKKEKATAVLMLDAFFVDMFGDALVIDSWVLMLDKFDVFFCR